jgi:hypothetical protein
MKAVSLLRLAALLALVQACAHTALFLTYTPKHGPVEVAVIEAMRAHSFSFSGSVRSYWDMYFGEGLFIVLNCFLQSALLWQLARMARTTPLLVRPIATLLLLANLGYFILVRRYFFPLPGYFDLAIAAVLGGALLALSLQQQPAGRTAAV